MKRLLLFTALFLNVLSLWANHAPKKVRPQIKEVTVFLNRAQVNSTTQTWIEAGTTEIILEQLSPYIDPQSIQVSGKGDFVIMGVKHQMNYMKSQEASKEIRELQDTIEKLQLHIRLLESYGEVFEKEQDMILSNKSIGGQENGLTAEALEEMADFYRDRLTEIKEEILDNEVALNASRKRLYQFQNQLNEITRELDKPSANIIITLSSKIQTQAALGISYVVSEAGWYPLYDVRVADTKGNVQLYYKAQVFQNTGENWNNVKLTLSTSNPTLGGNKPELNPWYVDIYETPKYKTTRGAGRADYAVPAYAPAMEESYAFSADTTAAAPSVSDYTQMVETTLSAEFQIALPYTINSGGNGQLVDIQMHQLKSTYRYYVAPKLDNTAFLTAMVTDWDGLNLLSGKANIYFEGTFVGETFFDIQNTQDTLLLSLGRDPKVMVKRESLKDYTSKSFMGSNRKEDYAWKIEVRNTKKDPIEIIIQDQYPVSQNSEIMVELLEANGASVNKDNGALEWKLNLNPAESKSVQFRYTLKYPKNKIVQGL